MVDPVPHPPAGEEDPFLVNRVPEAQLPASVPFVLESSGWEATGWEASGWEASGWEADGSADGTGEGWGAPGDYGLA